MKALIAVMGMALLIFSGCDISFSFQVPVEGDVQGISEWIKENIEYKKDAGGDFWQTPEETYMLRTGDCEDVAIFMMECLYLQGIDSQMAIMDIFGLHAGVIVDGVIYEPRTGTFLVGTLIGVLDRDEVIYVINHGRKLKEKWL